MRSFFILFLLAIGFVSSANITLPAVISSNMVLQQKASVKLWGWGAPTEKVYITTTWGSEKDSAVVTENAKWQVAINTPAAGGPYTITIKGSNTIVLENVLIGEVWVCSGQSNMEFNYNWGLPQMKEELPGAAALKLRFFTVPRTTAEAPQEDTKAQWQICDSNTLKSFSAVAFYFGKKLSQNLNVPIGLINASWGGTPAEVWTPAEKVTSDTTLRMAASTLTKATGWPITPGYTFSGMIAPLTNYKIAGAIWYQGESNTGTASTYQQLFTTMIQSWREKWNNELPFYFVQIAPFAYGNKNIGALLREAQTKTLALPKTGMVVTTDLVEDTLDIHPKNKRDVGFRLANLALTNTYAQTVVGAQSPVYKSMGFLKNKVLISLSNAMAIVVKGSAATGVFIAGADQQFYPAQATAKGNTLTVWNKAVPQPVAVRYAFSNTAIGNLFSKEGLPVAPFRTDDWVVDTAAK